MYLLALVYFNQSLNMKPSKAILIVAHLRFFGCGLEVLFPYGMVMLVHKNVGFASLLTDRSCLFCSIPGFAMSRKEFNFSKGVILKGLPFAISVEEIKTFFKTLSISNENIHLIKFRDGQQTGLGFVKLKDEDMEHALLMDKNHIGKRYVEVIASDETELHHLLLKARSGEMDARELNRIAGKEARKGVVKRDRSPIRRHLQTHFAYITGIPAHHQYKEVRRFFKGILIGMNCIHLLKERDSRDFRGDGYIEFKDSEECRKALLLDGESMDGSTIHIEPCTQEEFEDALRHEAGGGGGGGGGIGMGPGGGGGGGGGRYHRSPSPHFQEEEGYFTPAYREREGRYRNTIATMAYGGHGVINRTRDIPRVGGAAEDPLDRPPLWDSPHPHPPLDPLGHSDGLGQRPLLSQSFGRTEEKFPSLLSAGGGSLLGGGSNLPQKPLMGSPLAARVERKIVRLEGLPYDSTLHDIVDFFRGYGVSIEHVRIQCRDDGSPSGKAFVTFPSEKFAQGAIQELNRRYIRGRYVELFLV